MITLRHYMTGTPVFIRADDSIEAVQATFVSHSFRHLPVLMGDEVVGIVSERDVLLTLSLAGASSAEAPLTAADICTPDPYTVDVETPFDLVVRIMGERKFGAVIITEEGRLAGILTTTDICRLCAELLVATMTGQH